MAGLLKKKHFNVYKKCLLEKEGERYREELCTKTERDSEIEKEGGKETEREKSEN